MTATVTIVEFVAALAIAGFSGGVGVGLAMRMARKQGTIPQGESALGYLRARLQRSRRTQRELLTRGERIVAWTTVLMSVVLVPAGVITLLSGASGMHFAGIAMLVLAWSSRPSQSHRSFKRVCVGVNGRTGANRQLISIRRRGPLAPRAVRGLRADKFRPFGQLSVSRCFCQGIGPCPHSNRAQPELACCFDHARVEAGDCACVLLCGQQNAAVGELDTEVCAQLCEAR